MMSDADIDDAPVRSKEDRFAWLVCGVFWFTWMTARYWHAASMMGRIEHQCAELN